MTVCASDITVRHGGNGAATQPGSVDLGPAHHVTRPGASQATGTRSHTDRSTPRSGAGRPGWTLAADGSYAARLAGAAERGPYVERWTLGGSDAYTVELPVDQPESPDCSLLALSDGRVLIARPGDGRHHLALLYPTGPDTGELPLGVLESDRMTLLPPAPDGRSAYLLLPGFQTTAVWLVRCDGSAEPPRVVADVPGHCLDGHWLDRSGQLLALNRREPSGRITAVVVDLARAGAVSPLLEIGERSNDQLLLADPDSGLLLVRSDAPGTPRTGWGVLGSHRPVRFPEALRQADVRLAPFAVQPGQELMPENAAVALRAEGPNGTWVALWRPGQRELRHQAAPRGWLPGAGALDADGELVLPYVRADVRGVVRVSRESLEGPGEVDTAGRPAARPSGAKPRRNVTAAPVARTGTTTPRPPTPGNGATGGRTGGAVSLARTTAGVEGTRPGGPGRGAGPGPRPDDRQAAPVAAATVRGMGRVRAFRPPVPLQQAPLQTGPTRPYVTVRVATVAQPEANRATTPPRSAPDTVSASSLPPMEFQRVDPADAALPLGAATPPQPTVSDSAPPGRTPEDGPATGDAHD